jgi:type II secretory pathway pseudopilin PulG
MKIALNRSKQSGVALAVALSILLVLTVLTVTGMRGSILEQKMARNEQARMEAFEQAQSLIDAVIAIPGNLIVTQGVGYANCTEMRAGCNTDSITLPNDLDTEEAFVRVTRIAPELSEPPPGTGMSAANFDAAHFMVEATYDGTDIKQGMASIVQGTIVLVASGGQ